MSRQQHAPDSMRWRGGHRRARLAGVCLVALSGVVLCLGALSAPAARADAEPGDLDRGFDGDGRVVTDFGDGDGAANARTTRANRIVAAGDASGDFALAIYNLDGSFRFDRA